MDVYLLGAGFSNDAGIPTIKNFFKELSKLQREVHDDSIYPVMERALCYARSCKNNNIEELLLTAINQSSFFDLIQAFALTINYSSQQFLKRCQTGSEIGWYRDFVSILLKNDSHVFTFNYDLILEGILWWHAKSKEDYGIEFDESYCFAPDDDAKATLPLYKLHGSVSWLWCIKCGFKIDYCAHALKFAFMNLPCPSCSHPLMPMLIPPTFRKALHIAAPLKPLWARADDILSKAKRIIVGGLSLGDHDADFRHRFVVATAKNKNLSEIIIVNRDNNTCQEIMGFLPRQNNCKVIKSFPLFCKEFM